MIKILRLEAENFRSYSELALVMPETRLTLIDGVNLQTGGSNGSGKSTILDGVFWVLYGELPRGGAVDNVIKSGESKSKGRLEATVGLEHWVIERQRPLKLTVLIDGIKQERKAADLQDMIEEKFMSPTRFLLSCYLAQERAESFFSMSDTERTKLLSTIACLEKLDSALLKSKEQKSVTEKKLSFTEGSLVVLEGKLQQDKDRLGELLLKRDERQAGVKALEDIVEVSQGILESALAKLNRESLVSSETVNAKYTGLLEDKRVEIAAVAEIIAATTASISELGSTDPEPELKESVDNFQGLLKAVTANNQKRATIIRDNEHITGQISAKMDSLDGIQNGRCRECEQALPPAEIEKHLQAKLAEIKSLELSLKPIPEEQSDAEVRSGLESAQAAYQARRAELLQEPNRLRQEKKTQEAMSSGLLANVANLKMSLKSELSTIERSLKDGFEELKKEHKKTEDNLKLHLDVAAREAEELKNAQKRITTADVELENTRASMSLLEGDISLSEDLIAIFGPKGYRALCFDDLISRISDTANSYLTRLTDGVYQTRLVQVQEDSKGSGKIVLKPIILKSGVEIPLDFLSGGQKRRCSLSFDLAINTVAGEGLPLFLDEALDALDENGKEAALELLQELAATRPIFLIDHTNTVKSAVERILTAVYDNGTSSLVA